MNLIAFLFIDILVLGLLAFFCLSQVQAIREIRSYIIEILSINLSKSNKTTPLSTGIVSSLLQKAKYEQTDKFNAISSSAIAETIREEPTATTSSLNFKSNLANDIKNKYKVANKTPDNIQENISPLNNLILNKREKCKPAYNINTTKPKVEAFKPNKTEEKEGNASNSADDSKGKSGLGSSIGGAKPAASPLGANKPAGTPLGGAVKPAGTGATQFGGAGIGTAKPAGAAAPFGANKPAGTGASAFGGAGIGANKPAGTAASPFGAGKSATNPSNPLGAKPNTVSPFGKK